MRFYTDPQMAGDDVQRRYGHYIKSFESEHSQLRADLFQRGEDLVAFIDFSPGYDATNVTDQWISILRPEAERLGFGRSNLRIVYTGLALPPAVAGSPNGH